MTTFADDDSPDPNDPFGYLAEDARYMPTLVASSVLGVPITAPMASAARSFLVGEAEDIPAVLSPLAAAALKHETPLALVLRCALGPPCAVCGKAIEGRHIDTDKGAVHEGCEPGPQLNIFAALGCGRASP